MLAPGTSRIELFSQSIEFRSHADIVAHDLLRPLPMSEYSTAPYQPSLTGILIASDCYGDVDNNNTCGTSTRYQLRFAV